MKEGNHYEVQSQKDYNDILWTTFCQKIRWNEQMPDKYKI